MKERTGAEIPWKKVARAISLDKNAALHVICHDCLRVLYEPGRDDLITRIVAITRGDGHSQDFSTRHRVSVFKGTMEIYQTGNSRSFENFSF